MESIPSTNKPPTTIKPIARQPRELILNNPHKCKKLFKRNLHTITKFHLQLTDPPPSQILQRQKHTKTISSLHYIFPASSSKNLSFLISKLKTLHRITSLILDLSLTKSCTPQDFKNLSMTLASLKELASLTLIFPESVKMTPKHLVSFGFVLHRLRSLRNLALHFDPLKRLFYSSLNPFPKLLCKLTKLHSLSLSQFASASPLALTFLPPVLKKLASLQTLSLNLAKMENFPNKHLHQVFLLLKEKPLKNLAFNFEGCAIRFQSSCPISQGLAMLDLSQLQSFKLTSFSNPPDKILEEITAVLQASPLKSLNLDFSKVRFSCDFPDFSLDLRAFQSLLHLSLSPGNSKNGIQGVGAAIKSLVNLESLNINFSNQTGACFHNELINFSLSLRDLQNLKHFSLNLNGLEKITDKSLVALSDNIQSLNMLLSLNLQLAHLKTYPEKGVLSLLSSLAKLEKFAELSLNLFKNRKFDVKNLHTLGEAIENLALLNSVNFNFGNCLCLWRKDYLGLLCQSFGKLKFLRKICLHLSDSIEGQKTALDFMRYEDLTIYWV